MGAFLRGLWMENNGGANGSVFINLPWLKKELSKTEDLSTKRHRDTEKNKRKKKRIGKSSLSMLTMHCASPGFSLCLCASVVRFLV